MADQPELADQPGAARRALRRAALGSGPLKRRSDRIELASRLLTAVALVLAVPVALVVGIAVGADTAALARERAAAASQQEAVLLADAAGPDGSGMFTAPVRATWPAPDGSVREGLVHAPSDARAGDRVEIWVDRDGQRTRPPMDVADVGAVAVVSGLVTLLVVAATATGGHLLVCRVLWLRRAREWEEQWCAVEPLWSGRRRPPAPPGSPVR
ncbi:hypothetical protein GCM10023328_11730 [Modestobacter marinus]|uniref:Integral membrane protein n=1 Tax=Modestobacter marinus TaxID=477641 RepID=A0A846LSE2_9ACTN|nr:hypothetical protein [Modestobacter marinus]NIH69192.1 hypothetical protein [Modestobacter marinus]GGL76774.1 hypothetical protein GCM10011589_36080 [Modestobacter marinus]